MEKVLEHVSDNLSVEIIPDGKFEFLMTTNEVAKGFGVAGNTVRMHKLEHKDELIEGKHFIAMINGEFPASVKLTLTVNQRVTSLSKFFGPNVASSA